MLLFNTKATEKTTNFQYDFLKFVDPCNKNLRTILQQIKYSIQFNSIQFKALFRVDINHTYNTSSNELLKSTMVYNNTYNHAYRHIK